MNTGICIGGPHDGRELASRRAIVQVPLRQPLGRMLDTPIVDPEIMISIGTYELSSRVDENGRTIIWCWRGPQGGQE